MPDTGQSIKQRIAVWIQVSVTLYVYRSGKIEHDSNIIRNPPKKKKNRSCHILYPRIVYLRTFCNYSFFFPVGGTRIFRTFQTQSTYCTKAHRCVRYISYSDCTTRSHKTHSNIWFFFFFLVEPTPKTNVVISCVFYMSIVFVVSLVIKLSLRTYHERLTFVSHADDVKYHLTSLSMEIVEITEQYCYSMSIGISIHTRDTHFINKSYGQLSTFSRITITI